MRATIFTLFPHWFDGPLGDSVIQRARERGILDIRCINFREWATDRHATVDDAPYGGGGGMVLRADVLARALDATIGAPGSPDRPRVLLTSPRGRRFDQAMAGELAAQGDFAIVCGHYEGFDERFIETRVDEEVSIGDFVLTGGEIPAMAIIDAVARFVPGVLGNEDSAPNDSFMNGLLEFPHYTRPEVFEGRAVPPELLTGNHGAVAKWREAQALAITRARRPDLIAQLWVHPDQLRRLARRGRPFAIWRATGEVLFASGRVRALPGWRETVLASPWEQGLGDGIRLGEIKAAKGDSAEGDRAELKAELEAMDRREMGAFARNLLAEMQRLDAGAGR